MSTDQATEGNAAKSARTSATTKGPKKKAEVSSSGADLLVRLIQQVEAFHTPEGEAYVCVAVGNHREVLAAKSKALRNWLAHLYYHTRRELLSSEQIQLAVNQLDARARFDGKEESVHVRVANQGDPIYVDLGDPNWRVIEVTAIGWNVRKDSPVRFVRPRGMCSLPLPTPGGSISDLRPLINGSVDHNWILIIAWLVAAVRPTGPYTLLNLIGEQGSAKSTTARILKMLIDPGKASLRATPREERDLMISARNAQVLAFDNLSGIPIWFSDALCRLSTGGGLATRELYTDADEIIFDATRPVILCGIDDIATRSDLLDRSLVAMLPEIPERARKTEGEVWDAFRDLHATVLGALLDAVSLALREFPRTCPVYRPRMIDFVKWVLAAEPRLPWVPGAFIEAYRANRSDVVQASLDDDQLADSLMTLVPQGCTWSGTATNLLTELRGINTARSWKLPSTPKVLSAELRRSAPFLREAGVNVLFDRVGKKRTRTIFIENTGEPASAPSAPSASSPDD